MNAHDEVQRTLNPTCTGTSVIALQYKTGVVVLTDRVVSYGKMARYKNVSRQYKVNDNVLIAFGGDHADFHWLQNVIERQVLLWKRFDQDIGPKALHGYLTSLLYARRCKMNPVWNTLVVAGVEEEEKNNKETSTPFIGVITQKGCAYQVKHIATGLGAFLLNQAVEDEWRKKGEELSREDAEAVLRKSLELTLYHDCVADNEFEIGRVDANEGVVLGNEEKIIGDWSIAETNCQNLIATAKPGLPAKKFGVSPTTIVPTNPMNVATFTDKFPKFGFSPSKDKQPKSPGQDKKEKKTSLKYKPKMKLRYNLSENDYNKLKRNAQMQKKNWEEYRKEQVLAIFQSTSEAVSKSKKSDVAHPNMAKAKTVLNKNGEKVEVEFGRLKEHYLYSLAPCKELVSIRDHTTFEKELGDLREKQRISFEQRKDKQDTKKKLQAEYEQSKSVYESPAAPRQAKAAQPEQRESSEKVATPEKFIPNTTDKQRKQFPDGWYKQSISRSQLGRGKVTYWMGNEDDDELLIDDDPEGKYTVTAEKMIETLTAGGKVKDSGIVEPTSAHIKTVMTDSLSVVHTNYKKTSGREAVFLNTLKGTIDFMKKQANTEKTNNNTISQDEPTDALNQITFECNIIANVFKGKRIKRQYSAKKDLETFEENRKDYTREAGEETSGI